MLNSCFAQQWNVIFEDNFNGNSLDQTKWSHDLGTGAAQGLWGWGNGELQYYQPDNTSLNNGILTIEAREETQGISDFYSGFQPAYYSSSKILTRDKFEFKYGKVEARIKTIDGQGYWPAFWMLEGGCWPETGEIDIMEQWGNDGNTSITTGAAHLGNCGEGSNYIAWNNTISSGSYADDFHIYSVIWDEDFIQWYVDDVLLYSVTPSSYPSEYNWPFNDGTWFLILNLAITNSGPNANTTFPSGIQVDWVRVSQTNDVIGCTNPAANNYNSDATVDSGQCLFDVTFNVDMNCSNESYSTVYTTGPWANWCGDCYPLSDTNNDGVWTGTYEFASGEIEYKYLVDNWASQEDLIDDMQNGASCAPVTDFWSYANRTVSVSGLTSTLDSYGSCESCGTDISGCTNPNAINYNPGATLDDGSCIIIGCMNPEAINFDSEATDPGSCEFSVSFSLDMNEVSFSFTTPEVNGNWNSWCGGCLPMNDANSDNVWEASIVLPEGIYEFKYATDSWTESEDLTVGSSCTLTTGEFTNRLVNLNQNIVFETVCWNSCEACISAGCTDPLFIEYDPFAVTDDGSCSVLRVDGCTYPGASNYNPDANYENMTCVFDLGNGCPGDFTGDGAINVSDLGGFLGAFGTSCD